MGGVPETKRSVPPGKGVFRTWTSLETLKCDSRRATAWAPGEPEADSGLHPWEPIKSFWGSVFCSGKELATAH